MEIKDINLDDYEISKQSDEKIVMLKKKKYRYPKWENLENVKGHFVDSSSTISEFNVHDAKPFNKNIFLTEKHAKSALAIAQISQLMPHYGGEITDEEWRYNNITKWVVIRKGNSIVKEFSFSGYRFLAFYTAEQRDAFLENNEQLVKDYLMIE